MSTTATVSARAHTSVMMMSIGRHARRSLFALSEFAEIWMPQRLPRAHAILWIVEEQLGNEVDARWRDMRNKLLDTRAALLFEIEIDVLIPPLHLREELWRRRAHDVVDFLYLVKLVCAREEWVQRANFEKDAANAPHVHLVVVEAVREQAFRRAVPPRADVLRVRLFAARTKSQNG